MSLSTLQGQLSMSSLQIAEITGKDHKNVLADIRRILEEAGIEGAGFLAPFKMPSGQVATVYNLPRRECDLVVSGYSVKYRLAIIDRWQELEAKQGFQIPRTLPEALRLSADLAEKNEKLMVENQEMQPKAEFYDKITASKTVCQMAVAAQVAKLPFGRNTLFQFLREEGVLITGGNRHNLPKQRYVNEGYFTVEENFFTNAAGETFVNPTTYVTQKGISLIIRLYDIKTY